jgi:hypothetical protein
MELLRRFIPSQKIHRAMKGPLDDCGSEARTYRSPRSIHCDLKLRLHFETRQQLPIDTVHLHTERIVSFLNELRLVCMLRYESDGENRNGTADSTSVVPGAVD